MSLSQKKIKNIRLVYGIVLSVLIVAVGACLIWACLDIYLSGDSPFSYASISERFGRIRIPVYVCLVGILGGIILSVCLPDESKKPKGVRSEKKMLTSLTDRFDVSACEDELKKVKKEEALRKWIGIASAVVCIGLAIPVAIYFSNTDNFTLEGMTECVKTAVLFALPFLTLAFAICTLVAYIDRASIIRETAAVKDAIASGKAQKKTAPNEKKASGKAILIARCVILCAALVFIVLGIVNGGMTDVFEKAVKICTECIGLG